MRRNARKHQFDALIVHKFDHFARNRTDALAIKSLLRYDNRIKVFSVSEPTEDNDSPLGAVLKLHSYSGLTTSTKRLSMWISSINV